jgi:hypothetical protein
MIRIGNRITDRYQKVVKLAPARMDSVTLQFGLVETAYSSKKKKKQMPIPTWRTGETGYPFPFLDQSEGRLEKRIAPARRTPQNYKIKIPFHGSKPKPKRKKIEEKIFQRTANKTTESKRNFLVREGESMAEPHKYRSFVLRSNPRSNP